MPSSIYQFSATLGIPDTEYQTWGLQITHMWVPPVISWFGNPHELFSQASETIVISDQLSYLNGLTLYIQDMVSKPKIHYDADDAYPNPIIVQIDDRWQTSLTDVR